MKKSNYLVLLALIFSFGVTTPSQAADFSGSSSSRKGDCVTTTTWSWWGLVSESSTRCDGHGFVSEHPF
jgi:hypothetical protein